MDGLKCPEDVTTTNLQLEATKASSLATEAWLSPKKIRLSYGAWHLFESFQLEVINYLQS